jgi:hypothetical protein
MLPALAIDHLPPVSIAWRSKGVRSFLRLKPNLDRAAPLGSKTPQPYVEDIGPRLSAPLRRANRLPTRS